LQREKLRLPFERAHLQFAALRLHAEKLDLRRSSVGRQGKRRHLQGSKVQRHGEKLKLHREKVGLQPF